MRFTQKLTNTDLYKYTDIDMQIIADCSLSGVITLTNANKMSVKNAVVNHGVRVDKKKIFKIDGIKTNYPGDCPLTWDI